MVHNDKLNEQQIGNKLLQRQQPFRLRPLKHNILSTGRHSSPRLQRKDNDLRVGKNLIGPGRQWRNLLGDAQ